jgi:phage terminase large subunit GpA-like protein
LQELIEVSLSRSCTDNGNFLKKKAERFQQPWMNGNDGKVIPFKDNGGSSRNIISLSRIIDR